MKFLFISGLISFGAMAADPHQVLVQGRCDLKVVPDRGSVSFTAENQSKDQKAAVAKTNHEINLLKQKIGDLKLPELELKNTQYTVTPIREYEKERYVDKGIRASLTLEVSTSDIARLGEVMAIASQVGLKNAGSLETFLSEEKNKATYLKCLDAAADDARSKAQQLALKLGFKLGEVLMVSELPLTPSSPPESFRGMMKIDMSPDSSGGSRIELGEQRFSTTLTVSFSIK